MENNYDFYDILELKPDATIEQIKSAFRKKSVEYHPDKTAKMNLSTQEKNQRTETYKKITNAYATIGDEIKRKEYDSNRTQNTKSTRPKPKPKPKPGPSKGTKPGSQAGPIPKTKHKTYSTGNGQGPTGTQSGGYSAPNYGTQGAQQNSQSNQTPPQSQPSTPQSQSTNISFAEWLGAGFRLLLIHWKATVITLLLLWFGNGIILSFAHEAQPMQYAPIQIPSHNPSDTPTPSNTPTPQPTETPIPTDTPQPPLPTETPVPTDTPQPTMIPVPTDTPQPTTFEPPKVGCDPNIDVCHPGGQQPGPPPG